MLKLLGLTNSLQQLVLHEIEFVSRLLQTEKCFAKVVPCKYTLLYKKLLYKKPACRMPKHLKNVYYY